VLHRALESGYLVEVDDDDVSKAVHMAVDAVVNNWRSVQKILRWAVSDVV